MWELTNVDRMLSPRDPCRRNSYKCNWVYTKFFTLREIPPAQLKTATLAKQIYAHNTPCLRQTAARTHLSRAPRIDALIARDALRPMGAPCCPWDPETSLWDPCKETRRQGSSRITLRALEGYCGIFLHSHTQKRSPADSDLLACVPVLSLSGKLSNSDSWAIPGIRGAMLSRFL